MIRTVGKSNFFQTSQPMRTNGDGSKGPATPGAKVASVGPSSPEAVVAMDSFRVIFDGRKYDLKSFLRDHPGGVRTLAQYRGKSVVRAMEKFQHSTSAYHMLSDLADSDDDELKDANLTGGVSENGRIITNEEADRDVEEIRFLEELESRLDWSQPLLAQLDAIAPHYDKWVNSAVYRKCRLFASPLLESLTYTPWYLVPMFWVPVILYLGCTSFLEHVACEDSCVEPLTVFQYIFQVALGILLWTALEYCLHRWVFHLNPGSSPFMIRIHFLLHGMHHKMPFDGLRQVFPPIAACFITAVLYWGLTPILLYPRIQLTGALVGYLAYDMIHYYVHHGSPKDGSYLYAMKRYHSNHHFVNHDKAFGISSKLWDLVFNTFVRVRKLGFSLHWS